MNIELAKGEQALVRLGLDVQRRMLNKVFCRFIKWRSEAISSFDVQRSMFDVKTFQGRTGGHKATCCVAITLALIISLIDKSGAML